MGETGFNTILPHIKTVLSGHRVEYETNVDFSGIGPRLLHVIYTPDKDQLGQVNGWIGFESDVGGKDERGGDQNDLRHQKRQSLNGNENLKQSNHPGARGNNR